MITPEKHIEDKKYMR